MSEEIQAWACGCCGELWETEEEAEYCCEPRTEQITAYKCEGCGKIYDEKEDADYCCSIANMNAEKEE